MKLKFEAISALLCNAAHIYPPPPPPHTHIETKSLIAAAVDFKYCKMGLFSTFHGTLCMANNFVKYVTTDCFILSPEVCKKIYP